MQFRFGCFSREIERKECSRYDWIDISRSLKPRDSAGPLFDRDNRLAIIGNYPCKVEGYQPISSSIVVLLTGFRLIPPLVEIPSSRRGFPSLLPLLLSQISSRRRNFCKIIRNRRRRRRRLDNRSTCCDLTFVSREEKKFSSRNFHAFPSSSGSRHPPFFHPRHEFHGDEASAHNPNKEREEISLKC